MSLSKDGWGGVAVLAASLFLIWLTLGLKDNPLVPVGPGFYPRIVLGITAVFAFALVVADLWAPKKHAEREKLASKLTWLEEKQKDPQVRDLRKQARIIPENPHSMLTFADGTIRPCFIIDMSASGAARSAHVQPEIGTPLAVGVCVGRVVRHLELGFAIKFVEQQQRDHLERLVVRPASLPSLGSAKVAARAR